MGSVEFALLGQHDAFDLVRLQALRALNDNLVDRHLPALGDAERHADVSIGQPVDLRRHADLEVALLLVGFLQLLGGPCHLDGVVHGAELEADLLLEGCGIEALVTAEGDVADEGTFGNHEYQLDTAFEVFDLGLHIIEEAEREDRPNIVRESRRDERAADLGGDAAQDDRFLDAAVTLDCEVLDDDRSAWSGRGGRLPECRADNSPADPRQGQDKKNCESRPPPRGHGSSAVQSRTSRSSVPPARASARRSESRGR